MGGRDIHLPEKVRSVGRLALPCVDHGRASRVRSPGPRAVHPCRQWPPVPSSGRWRRVESGRRKNGPPGVVWHRGRLPSAGRAGSQCPPRRGHPQAAELNRGVRWRFCAAVVVGNDLQRHSNPSARCRGGSLARTRRPSARALRITWLPTFPTPTTPIVFPASAKPTPHGEEQERRDNVFRHAVGVKTRAAHHRIPRWSRYARSM